MKTQDVVELLSGLSYRPGWTFDAYAPFDGDVVLFEAVCKTVDTSRDCAERDYDTPKTLEWQEFIHASSYEGREDLLSSVFSWLMAIEVHEAREFFRLKNEGYAAPFHPHRADGTDAWQRSFGAALASEL